MCEDYLDEGNKKSSTKSVCRWEWESEWRCHRYCRNNCFYFSAYCGREKWKKRERWNGGKRTSHIVRYCFIVFRVNSDSIYTPVARINLCFHCLCFIFFTRPEKSLKSFAKTLRFCVSQLINLSLFFPFFDRKLKHFEQMINFPFAISMFLSICLRIIA